jgi:hypothetical protein
MTHRAVLWETTRLVIRICRRRKVRPMTVNAVCGESRVLIVRVTTDARDRAVCPGQRKFSIVVRER